jgi:HAE1 family hydrophobic/amphiphilic exporter-1
VFIPIFFMPGVIGLLFHELAVVVGLSIVVSAFVSLTLVPMLARRFLTDEAHTKPPGGLVTMFEHGFAWTLALYTRQLDVALRHRRLTLLLAASTFAATVWLFMAIPKGFFPEEDIGQIQVSTEASEDISFPEMVRLQERAAAIFRADPNVAAVNSFNGGSSALNTGRMFVTLKPQNQRLPMKKVVEGMRKKLKEVAGINVFMRPVQNCSSAGAPARRSSSTSCKASRPMSSAAGPSNCKTNCAPTRCSAMSPATPSCAPCRPSSKSTATAPMPWACRWTPSARPCSAPLANARSPPSTCPPTATR